MPNYISDQTVYTSTVANAIVLLWLTKVSGRKVIFNRVVIATICGVTSA